MTTYVFVSEVLEETIDTVVNPLRNRTALRVWWEGNDTRAIIKLMPGAEHEFSVRHFATNLSFKIQSNLYISIISLLALTLLTRIWDYGYKSILKTSINA